MDRVRFVSHQGKQILFVDITNCTAAEVAGIAADAEAIITQQPPGSALIMADFAGAQFTKEAVNRIKEATARDRPHVRRTAWVGTENLPEVFYKAIRTFSLREFPCFKTREEALDFLVKE